MNLGIATASADLTIYDEMSISEATPHAAFFGLATSKKNWTLTKMMSPTERNYI